MPERFNSRLVGLRFNGRDAMHSGRAGQFNAISTPSGRYRQRLNNILAFDGTTVANYRADTGVTGVLNASALANQIGIAGPLLQATALNQAIHLAYSGHKYGYLPGVAGNYLSTPDTAAITTVTTGAVFVVEIDIAPDDIASASDKYYASQWNATGNQKSWILGTNGSRPVIYISLDGATSDAGFPKNTSANYPAGFGAGLRDKIRFSRTAATGVIQVHTSVDGGTTWVKLGNDITSTAGALFDSNAAVAIGAHSAGASVGTSNSGKFYELSLAASLGGTPVVNFKASDWIETTVNGATKASSTTGEVWTLVNTGPKLAQIVGSSQLLYDGVAGFMQTGAETLNAPYCIISVEKAITWTSTDVSFDGRTANSFAAQQFTGTPQMRLHDGGADSATIAPVLNTYNIITASQTAAGAALLQLNNGVAVSQAMSATAMAGFTSGADGAGANFWNGQKKEQILLNAVPSAAKLAQIISLLNSIHGVF